MKQLIIISIFIFLNSCIGYDTAFLPLSIDESKQDGLYICEYTPSKKFVKINSEEYEILQVWSTHKFYRRYSNEISNNFFAIRISIVNIETGDNLPPDDWYEYIKDYCSNCDYGGIGINSRMLTIYYKDIEMKYKICSFDIGFSDEDRNEDKVTFVMKEE
jgi:hypothetical protein